MIGVLDVCEMIDAVRAYLEDERMTGDKSLDIAALHALALLLAALTAPAPATCAPGCVRLATEGPGHLGAYSAPEVKP